MMQALAGITVVSIEQAVAAPLCTARLADAGARVIKVERAEGDFARDYDSAVHGESTYFVWLNRGKQSLAADLKNSDDLALVRRILADADVFVQNLAPGAAERLGLGADDLRRDFPRLICCSISGYGEDGPYARRKAYDLLIQCESGMASITGSPHAAGRIGVSAADIACGMNAHAAVLEALLARERTGQGSIVSVSLFDAMADFMAVPLLQYDYAGKAPERVGIAHASIAPYGAYATGDGVETVFAIQNEREWRNFCTIVLESPDIAGDPRFASNEARCASRGDLDAAIGAVLGGLDAATLEHRLEQGGIAFGRLNDVAGLSRHPQLRRVTVETPGGPAQYPAPAPLHDRTPLQPGPVPRIDSHGEAIRREFAEGW
ncbi:CaiB/BaiF CoA-transferase family protein [Croceicoccus sp. Ery5]|uniref:CaiB/BaiF CoA transferase family protein n=1 Tax=Croceicoccus sp. Ery5 TaxID=1703340 RepID=UPI001E3A2AEB|nr:CaiB/BaiF CoA-transferase family protein [Croceicoccus sp. Ery5]